MIKKHVILTKPGIVLGNAITTAGGFALASKGHFDFSLFGLTLLGLCMRSRHPFNSISIAKRLRACQSCGL